MRAVGLWEGFFDAVVTCNDVMHGKPHPGEQFLRRRQAAARARASGARLPWVPLAAAGAGWRLP